MFAGHRRLLCASVAYLFFTFFVYAQETGAAKDQQLDFSGDPCGNPLMESEGWALINGTVSKIVDGRTFLLITSDDHRVVRVRLAGIALDPRATFSKNAKEFLAKELLNKSAEVLVNPSKWDSLDKHPKKVVGVVGAPSDVALTLLSEGFVRFEQPRPYTMSSYTACQYRRAEADAHAQNIGLWQ